jgi:D-beta-D-heptose 7-phosphate kinase/D-beta-D-heptose 1-phosphate adenosyltransferase
MRPALPTLTAQRATDLITRMASSRVLVVGDVMLDQFIIGGVTRISPEAPVPVVSYERDEYRAGGAANVALNVRALGGDVELIGVVGEDEAAGKLRDVLRAGEVGVTGLVTDHKRRTTTKTRVVTTRNQQVARIDYETDVEVTAAIESSLADQIHSRIAGVGAVVVSDYLKGVVTRAAMAAIVGGAQAHGLPVLVDPKIPHLDYYSGATLVTPNHHEAEIATHRRIRSDDEAERAAQIFRERANCDGVLITRGEHGMWLSSNGVEGPLHAAAREVSDVTGAGDTVVATLALALAAGATLLEAAHLANHAAGIVVGKFGTATVGQSELRSTFNV